MMIRTGGTLSMIAGDGGTTLSPTAQLQTIVDAVPSLASIADIETHDLFNLDSGDLQPTHWLALASAVHQALSRDDVAGVVIVHGTDTMSYTASALSFLLGAIPRPVVLTGAQRPLADVRSDARSNLVDATIVATLPVPEVVVAFASRIFRGCRTIKADAWAFEAFASPGAAPLVELGLGVTTASHVRPAGALAPLDPRIETRVLAVRIFPGLDPRLVIGAIRAGVRGLVLEGYGTGNLPSLVGSSVIPAIEEASARGVPVVVVSQCPRGHVELERYAGGAAAARAGAIDGGDMTVEAAIAKMMVALGRHPAAVADDASGDERAAALRAVRAFMLADLAGERTSR